MFQKKYIYLLLFCFMRVGVMIQSSHNYMVPGSLERELKNDDYNLLVDIFLQ